MLHCIQNVEKQEKSNHTEQKTKKKNPKKKNSKESNISHNLTCKSEGYACTLGCSSDSVSDTIFSECPSSSCTYWTLTRGICLLEFSVCGFCDLAAVNISSMQLAAQCCPQSITAHSQSIIRPGDPPWTCLEDDNIWQWWPGTNKYTLGANSYQNSTE